MEKTILYLHGQGGSAEEAAHYQTIFPNDKVIAWDYAAQSPWEAKDEFPKLLERTIGRHETVTLIANSIGAYFAMAALPVRQVEKAYFISPVVNMEKLIEDMMASTNVSEKELREKGTIETPFGQNLSWDYLSYVREHPINWCVPTHILYGEKDNLISRETISAFALKAGATLTVMESGEHWFHTAEQMRFLDDWLKVLR